MEQVGVGRASGRTAYRGRWFLALLVFHVRCLSVASMNPATTRPIAVLPRTTSFLPDKSQAWTMRGGNSDPATTQSPYGYEQQQPQQYQQQQQYEQQPPQPPTAQFQQQQYDPQPPYEEQLQTELGMPPTDPASDPFRETNQDRIDRWRNYQREHQAEQMQMGPRDEKGRMKLLVSVSKGSRAFTFFLLMWRNVHLYETVDQAYKGVVRLMGVTPLAILFLANMAGVVASITSPSHSAKKRLKAILNLDKLLELYLIVYSLFRLIFAPSPLVPREMYISHIMHSFFFLIQCQAVTKMMWNDEGPPMHEMTSGGYRSIEEDEDGDGFVQQQQQQWRTDPPRSPT